jgi:hypothetical protein
VNRVSADARRNLEAGVGLALLGLQRWLSVRREVEDELDRLGLGSAARVSRVLGDAVGTQLTRLVVGPPTGRRGTAP